MIPDFFEWVRTLSPILQAITVAGTAFAIWTIAMYTSLPWFNWRETKKLNRRIKALEDREPAINAALSTLSRPNEKAREAMKDIKISTRIEP